MSDWTNPPTAQPGGWPAEDGANESQATASTSGVLHPGLTARHIDLRRWPAAPALSRWVERQRCGAPL
jgi:hypothetical protein